MECQCITDQRRLFPGWFDLKQYANGTNKIVWNFTSHTINGGTFDLRDFDAFLLLSNNGRVNEVQLSTRMIDADDDGDAETMQAVWNMGLEGTQFVGNVRYQIVFRYRGTSALTVFGLAGITDGIYAQQESDQLIEGKNRVFVCETNPNLKVKYNFDKGYWELTGLGVVLSYQTTPADEPWDGIWQGAFVGNACAAVWSTDTAVMGISSSIPADDRIVANFPTILRQLWNRYVDIISRAGTTAFTENFTTMQWAASRWDNWQLDINGLFGIPQGCLLTACEAYQSNADGTQTRVTDLKIRQDSENNFYIVSDTRFSGSLTVTIKKGQDFVYLSEQDFKMVGIRVITVNGKTGIVNLTANDLNAAPLDHSHSIQQVDGWREMEQSVMNSILEMQNQLDNLPPCQMQEIVDNTKTSVTIASLEEGKRYVYLKPLTKLQITAVPRFGCESEIEFTAASGISVTYPSGLGVIPASGVTFTSGKTYVLNFRFGIITIAEVGKGDGTATPPVTVILTGLNSTTDADTYTVKVGDEKQLGVAYVPNNTTQTGVAWRSSNPAIASVSDTGKVLGVGEGTAAIAATSKHNGNLSVFWTFNVESNVVVPPDPVVVELTALGRGVTDAEYTAEIGDTIQLGVEYTPADTTQTGVVWSSNNTAVAEVSEQGLVSVKAVGNAVITATSEYKPNLSVEWGVRVESKELTALGRGNTQTSYTLKSGQSVQLEVSYTPEDTDQTGVTWESSDSTIVEVDSNGLVTASNNALQLNTGSAVVTATSNHKPNLSVTWAINIDNTTSGGGGGGGDDGGESTEDKINSLDKEEGGFGDGNPDGSQAINPTNVLQIYDQTANAVLDTIKLDCGVTHKLVANSIGGDIVNLPTVFVWEEEDTGGAIELTPTLYVNQSHAPLNGKQDGTANVTANEITGRKFAKVKVSAPLSLHQEVFGSDSGYSYEVSPAFVTVEVTKWEYEINGEKYYLREEVNGVKAYLSDTGNKFVSGFNGESYIAPADSESFTTNYLYKTTGGTSWVDKDGNSATVNIKEL